MAADDKRPDAKDAIERRETAGTQNARDITKLGGEVALLIEALEQLDLYKFRGREHTTAGENARDRYRAIVKRLRSDYPAAKE